MRRVFLPVRLIPRRQSRVFQNEQVLRVGLLGGCREIVAARNNGFPVNHHDFGVRNRMNAVDSGRDARVHHVFGARISGRGVGFIQQDEDFHAALVRSLEG